MGMITIIHGDDQLNSRNYLNEVIKQQKQQSIEIHWIDGTKISKQDLETTLQTTNLFTTESIVIENLLSRTKSKEKTLCIDLIAKYKGDKNIIIWEKKNITQTTIKPIKQSQKDIEIKAFKPPFIIFKFLEVVSPKQKQKSISLLHQVTAKTDATFVFVMLARHISKLIMTKTNPEKLSGSPWQKSKIAKQASEWTIDQLITFHNNLLNIDYQIKTGKSILSVSEKLDLLIMEL